MFFQDWNVATQLSAFRRSYARVRGERATPERHQVVVNTRATGDTIASGQLRRFVVEMPSDADFAWMACAGYLSEPLFVIKDRVATVLIRFYLSQRGIYLAMGHRRERTNANNVDREGWIPIENVVSRGTGNPHFWPYPILFRPNDYVIVELYRPSAYTATAAVPDITLDGFKMYGSRLGGSR